MNALTGIKNLIWALGIAIVVLVLVIGLIITMVTGFGGQRQDGTMQLGNTVSRDSLVDNFGSKGDEFIDGGMTSASGLKPLPGSQDTGLEYLFNLTFLCDNSFSNVNSFGANFGSTASAQVWLPASGSFPAQSAGSTGIIYPNDGSEKTPASAAELYQPSRLVIYLGSDGLSGASQESFVAGYSAMVQDIQRVSPQTKIICCSIASVAANYMGSDGLTAALISQANGWIEEVCIATGVYYADLASILNDDTGALKAEYASPDGRNISSAGINQVMDYLRMHGV